MLIYIMYIHTRGTVKITEYNDIFIRRKFTICFKSQISRTLKTAHFRFILIQLKSFALYRAETNSNSALFNGSTKETFVKHC